MPRSTSQTSTMFLTASLRSGLQIATFITGLSVLITSIFWIGRFIGRPWAGLFLHMVQYIDSIRLNLTPDLMEFTKTIGGFAALAFSGIALVARSIAAENESNEKDGEEYPWTTWKVASLFLSSAIAGLVALAVTGTLIQAVGWGVPS